MTSAPDTMPNDSLTLQQVVTVINQSVVVALNIKLIERTNRIWAELQDLSRDYNGWTYGTLRDGDFTCGVRLPSPLAQTLTPGQIGWWTGTFETVARSNDSRGRLSQYDAWRFVVRTFDRQGVSERREQLRQAEAQLTQEGILPYHPKEWPLEDMPWRIALIGQPQTKGWDDVEVKLAAASALDLQRIPVNIGQVGSIVEGIARANQARVMALLLVRGGGNVELFDQPAITRALAQSAAYTIAGIGHATDQVMANLAVDYAATTPTDAAGYVLERLDGYQQRVSGETLRQQNQVLQQQLKDLQETLERKEREGLAARRTQNPWILIAIGMVVIAVVVIVATWGGWRG
ncbi:MAG: hypothetical protein C7B46_20550 [Sulfobacillus benefaciens]|uniref:Exonuclease VII large subunit C-terminal domain-containing protein n=1 Tax=Sulfobacillus benefaciens TaxID=453960 RepID=A0A2T2WTZ0_9FIRM|nr:MAG: hypothetical protein C7B46_20550 [Sulfobacillus benefaciens]